MSLAVEKGEWSTDRLPPSWKWVNFDDFWLDHTDAKRKLPQNSYLAEGALPVVDQGAELIGGYTNDTSKQSLAPLPVVIFGDHTRTAKYINKPFVQGADGVRVLRANRGIEPLFAFHALRCVKLPDKGYSRHFKFLRATLFPVAPIAEQRRIVAKLDSLSAKTKRARDQLGHVPRLVEKFKQAILMAAFRGDLTREWRSSNRVASLSGPRDYADLDLNDEERGKWSSELLPEGWEWREFSGVFEDVTDNNRKLPQKEYVADGLYPVIDQGETLIGGYTDKEELLHRAAPPFIIFGDHTRCVKFFAMPFVQGADGVKVLRTVANIEPLFGRYALSAVELPDKGYSRHMKFLRATCFPVTGHEEQHEIVRRIETAFAWINRLAAETTSAHKLIDHLDQAVLAKAFRGELVPQDAGDEPASILLERIRADRDARYARERGDAVRSRQRASRSGQR